MDILILRLEAPLMSFGAPIVDRHGEIRPFPARSMIAGLVGNALGYDHSEFEQLQSLQDRINHASRQDRRGEKVQDYQTVDLSKEYMDDDRAWTTWGELEERKGGSASSGTHIRLRDYWADASHTVALTLDKPEQSPTLDEVERALDRPERPLFIGRKPCLPAKSLVVDRVTANTLKGALQIAPLANDADQREKFRAWWPVSPNSPDVETQPITDERDWANQIHVGERWIKEDEIKVHAGDSNG